jgi:hypothetical protein
VAATGGPVGAALHADPASGPTGGWRRLAGERHSPRWVLRFTQGRPCVAPDGRPAGSGGPRWVLRFTQGRPGAAPTGGWRRPAGERQPDVRDCGGSPHKTWLGGFDPILSILI